MELWIILRHLRINWYNLLRKLQCTKPIKRAISGNLNVVDKITSVIKVIASSVKKLQEFLSSIIK